MRGARFNPPELQTLSGIGRGHPSGPACPHPPIHPRQLQEGHQNCRHRRQHAIHTALALHRRPLQVRTQLAAVGRGGQAAPLLPPVPRSADINPVFQHRVPKIPPLDRPGPAPWQRACPPTLTSNLSGRSHHDLAGPLVEPASLGEQRSDGHHASAQQVLLPLSHLLIS